MLLWVSFFLIIEILWGMKFVGNSKLQISLENGGCRHHLSHKIDMALLIHLPLASPGKVEVLLRDSLNLSSSFFHIDF